MLAGLYAAATGLKAVEKVAAVNAENIANLTTPGFKSRLAALSEMARGGVKSGRITQNNAQGPLINTHQPYDTAILGEGTFQVENSADIYHYTRNGVFSRDIQGNIVDPSGRILFRNVPYGARIGEDGTLYDGEEAIGRIEVYGAAPAPRIVPAQKVISGMLELSKVTLAEQSITMITNQRALEASVRSVWVQDELLGSIINMKS